MSERLAESFAAVIASVFFGVYHFGHSPPFNKAPPVAFLSVIGLVTSAYYFVSGDVYGTIAFHNFLGITGVIGALWERGSCDVIAAERALWIGPGARGGPRSAHIRHLCYLSLLPVATPSA